MPDDGQVYSIFNQQTHTFIDLSGRDRRSVFGWENNGGNNQRWVAESQGDFWAFRSIAAPRFLSASRNSREVGTSDRPTFFDVYPIGNDNYVIRVPDGDLVFELRNSNNGAPITVNRENGEDSQSWVFLVPNDD